MLYMCIEYHIQVNMYHVSAQGVDERMKNVHYYYYFTMLCMEMFINFCMFVYQLLICMWECMIYMFFFKL